ncbi:serine hydrolase domain-containing protein [Roseiterribacter gracilis]|uniref:Beta-lactamase-related domain-containing protein n=1 Tax=Roseiterribacter gracilis TaxID=2812848 RepID=A0A8S8XET7_9PROT|nr:hypothetical protein TMPK1_21740 [Rhodospirillales bacterium TMPK1]
MRDGTFRKIGSVLVARHGKLVFEKYFEGDAATLRDTRSATKSITGMLIGIAIAQRKLPGVDASVLSYFPAYKRSDDVTVKDLLTMDSSLDCDDNDAASPGNEERMYPRRDWVEFALTLPSRGAPPLPFHYCTAGTVLLGALIEKTTGQKADKFAERVLFRPLGITAKHWQYSGAGQVMTGGSLDLRSRDLLKLGQLYLQLGEWNGTQLMPRAWVEESTRAQLPAVPFPDTDYGYLLWLNKFTPKGAAAPVATYAMSGNGGNKVYVIPSLDMVVVITSTNYNTRGMHQQSETLLTDYILPAVR